MEKRMIFSKHPIEKAYVWHEMARSHLKNARSDECCVLARRSIDEAKKCGSLIWKLLGLILVCKSHAVMRKIEKIQETLDEAKSIARRLKDGKIRRYIDLLCYINSQDAQEKKLQEDIRKAKSSRHSMSTTRNSSYGGDW